MRKVMNFLASLAIALVVLVVGLLSLGYKPSLFFTRGLSNAVTTSRGILGAFALSTPWIFTALAWIVSKSSGVANLGVEGTVFVAALGIITVGSLVKAPPGVHHFFSLAAGTMVGMVWMLIPAFLKYVFQVHEVLVTLMLNWVAIYLTGFVIVRLLRDPAWPMLSLQILPSSRLYPLSNESSLTCFVFVALFMTFCIYILLRHTRFGLRMRATGLAEFTARSLGVKTQGLQFSSFLLAGVLAGCAAFSLTAGMPPYWRITDTADILVGQGFNGIAVAALANSHPLVVPLAASILGVFTVAVRFSQIYMRIPAETVNILVGILLLILALPELTRFLLRSRSGL